MRKTLDQLRAENPLPTPVEPTDLMVVRRAGVDYAITGDQLSEVADSVLRADLAAPDPAKGATLVTFVQAGVGAVARTLTDKAYEQPTISDGGLVDDDAVAWAEASPFPYIDLLGADVATTATLASMVKGYYNGSITGINSFGGVSRLKPRAPLSDVEIARPRTKSPLIDWEGKNVLWLGTSIPHFNAGIDSYPDLFGVAMECYIDNQAWSGSTAGYDVNGDPFSITTVKSLSMTEDDRVAGLAAHGGASAYDDTFDPITKASAMTADARIKNRFTVTPFDVVILDHNHNDRVSDSGTLTPESSAITGVVKGATTQITVNNIGTFAIGDAVAVEVDGIAFLNHAAARVQGVAGNTITVNINSAAYVGAFVSGTAYKLDRSTIYGAWEFLIHYIKNIGIINGKDTLIVLAGAPSEFTNAVPTTDHSIYSSASYILEVAQKWGLAFFDIGFIYDVDADRQNVYFPDTVHPTTRESRQALANHWIEWARGGSHYPVIPAHFLPASVAGGGYSNNREALYSTFAGGFATPGFVVGSYANVFSDNFSDGDTVGWTNGGGAVPTVVAAPWGGTDEALRSAIAPPGSTTASIYRTIAPAITDSLRAEFDLWLDQVTGLTDLSGATAFGIASFSSNATPRYDLSLVVRTTGVTLRLRYSESFGGPYITVPLRAFQFNASTKYNIRIEVVPGATTYAGGILLYVDDVLLSEPTPVNDSAWVSAVNRFYIGIAASSTAKAGVIHIGNVVVDKAVSNDYSQRYTGTFMAGVLNVKVVNGIIVSVT